MRRCARRGKGDEGLWLCGEGHGSSVDHCGDTFRAMYTTKIGESVFVLRVFKKKSTQGIATPQKDLDLIERCLKEAVKLHTQLAKERKREKN